MNRNAQMSFPFQSQTCPFLPQDHPTLMQAEKVPSFCVEASRSKGYALTSQNHSDPRLVTAPKPQGPVDH